MENVLPNKMVELKQQFAQFADECIAPYAYSNDRNEKLAPEIIQSFKSYGYLGSMIPKQYGGMEMNYFEIGILNYEIGKVCSSSRALLTVHGMVALAILRWGTEEQKSKWLPKLASGEVIGAFGLTEPEAGSDSKSIEMKGEANGDYFILNGVKKWITMSQIAGVFLVFGKVEGKDTSFLVERNSCGLKVNPISGLMGARASMMGELHFDNCIVPKSNLVGKIGFGLSHIALTSLDYGRYTIAWGCVGAAETCLSLSIKYAKQRKQFGNALRKNQLIQKMIAEMVVEIEAARLICEKAGRLNDEGDPDYILQVWIAKYYSSKMLIKVSGDAVQIFGAKGCHNEYPIDRIYRDAKLNEIIEGSSQIHEILIANNAFMTTR